MKTESTGAVDSGDVEGLSAGMKAMSVTSQIDGLEDWLRGLHLEL